MSYRTTQIKEKVASAFEAGNSNSHLVEIFWYHRNAISRWVRVSKKDPKFSRSRKPQKRYFEACQEKQSSWVSGELVQIKKVLKAKKAILYFEDESSIDLSPVLAKTWGPIGKKIIQVVVTPLGLHQAKA